jgi:carbonic anhydrase/acetyltransferase-like protein (isoleucine patch superfamily)
MNIRTYRGIAPQIGSGAYVDPAAVVIGDVHIGEESSIWPMAVVRGDVNSIRIGKHTNIQDGSVLHVTHVHKEVPEGLPLHIGDEVTVGHNVNLHGCTVGNRCLIGMGSTVLDGAVLEDNVYLGAGSLVPPGKVLEGGYLWLGSPVKRVRPLSEQEIGRLAYSAAHYVRLKEEYQVHKAG